MPVDTTAISQGVHEETARPLWSLRLLTEEGIFTPGIKMRIQQMRRRNLRSGLSMEGSSGINNTLLTTVLALAESTFLHHLVEASDEIQDEFQRV